MNLTVFFLIIHAIIASISIIHALLYKKDPRSALGWIAVCFAYPIVGPLLYYFFGINRVKTRAYRLTGKRRHYWFDYEGPNINFNPEVCLDDKLRAVNFGLIRSSAAVTHRKLTNNNKIVSYFTGDDAYQAMLNAIATAKNTVCLSSYIFDTSKLGKLFINALSDAHNRGVKVYIIIDGIGELYSYPRARTLLKKMGLDAVSFIPPKLFPPSFYINLRNHKKLLIIDEKMAFTGGMNISDRHLCVTENDKPGIQDIHFKLEGEIVSQLQDAFDEDWLYSSKKQRTNRNIPLPTNENAGQSRCRAITDGPNEDIDKLISVILSAVAVARERIVIMTPYFLPPQSLLNALQTAALRGVEVTIILPQRSNLFFIDWATKNILWELLQYGIKVYFQPAPFNHSKLLFVDDDYAQIGSANIDPRSLRLNFELTVEVYDHVFVTQLSRHIESIIQVSTPTTLEELDDRPLFTRIKDALAWLFSPYL